VVPVTALIPVHNLVASNNRYAMDEMRNRSFLNNEEADIPAKATADANTGTLDVSSNPMMLAIAPQQGHAAPPSGASVWVSGFGGDGNYNDPAGGLPDYNTQTSGALAGFEMAMDGSAKPLCGLALGVAQSYIDVKDGDRADIQSVLLVPTVRATSKSTSSTPAWFWVTMMWTNSRPACHESRLQCVQCRRGYWRR